MARENSDAVHGDAIAVLPLGATEYHGPHLPAETDTIIAQGIARRLALEIGQKLNVEFLPVEPVGYSPEHLDHTATRSLGYAEAIERWIGIGEMLASRDVGKMMMLNAHGGNSPLMTVVATELRVRFNMLCVATGWTRFDLPEGIMSDHELAFGIHAGRLETSVMLALAPDRVKMEAAHDYPSFQEILVESNRYLSAYGKHAFGWKMSDLNASGAVGDATSATAEIGETVISNAVRGLALLLTEIDRFDLQMFAQKK